MPSEFETGAFANTPAWHGAGVVVQGFMSTAEAFTKSGLDWPGGVEKRPLFAPPVKVGLNALPESLLEASAEYAPGTQAIHKMLRDPILVPDRFAVVRNMDNGVLGVVGPDYQCIQNIEMFNFLDALTTGEDKVAQWESAGALRGGRRVWALLNLVESEIIVGAGDKVLPYLLVHNAHDGSGSCKVQPVTVRVVCMNTLEAAIAGQFRELTVTIRHTGDVKNKLAAARLVLAKAGEMFGAFGRVANELAEKAVAKADFETLVDELFPLPELNEDGSPVTKAALTRVENERSLFAQAVREEVKLLPAPGEGFTYWALLNGATRYADHSRKVQVGRKRDAAEARFESLMLGSGAAFKERAARRVIELAGVQGALT